MEIHKQKRGFTMIELLIVVAIIGIAATITWSNLAHSRNVKKVSNACESVLVLANKTRAYALSGQVGVKEVSLICSASGCSIQTKDANGSVVSSQRPEDTFNTTALQGVSIVLPSTFSVTYMAPYAESSVDTSVKFSLGTIKKTLTINKFTAVCK